VRRSGEPRTYCGAGSLPRSGALTKCGAAAGEEVVLADLDAAVTQDRVSSRDVEERVGDDPADEVVEALELQRAVAQRHLDDALFGALEGAGRYALDEIDRTRD